MNLYNTRMHLGGRNIALYITMAVYVGSLFLPGLVLTNEVGQTMTQYGYQILILGLLGIFAGLFPVYGYVLGIVSFIAIRSAKKSVALACSILGLLLGLQAMYLQTVNAQINFFDSYNSWEKGMGVLSAGYYLWMFALALLAVQCVLAYFGKTSYPKV